MSAAQFDELVTQHGAALLRLAYLLCRDAGGAEDLVQDALEKALRHQRRNGPPAHPAAYLRKIVLNEYLAWRRRRVSSEVVGLPTTDPSAADFADPKLDRLLMWQLLGGLSPRARAVLVLRYYEALSDREIAEHLGCAEATVRSIAARAFAVLRADPAMAELAAGRGLDTEA